MKQFIKNVFSSAIGVLLALGILIFIGVLLIAGTVATTQKSSVVEIKDGSILHLQLVGTIAEQDMDDALNIEALMSGNKECSPGLNVIIKSIKKAAESDKIKGIFLEAGAMAAEPATLQAIHRELMEFRKSGKFIMAYADSYTQGTYYICSAANKIALNPSGEVSWKGLASRPMYYKNLLDKVGVKMQVFKVGTFKSAVEPFVNTAMSDADRKQVTTYLGSVWQNIINDVSIARNIPVDTLQALADRNLTFIPAEELVSLNVVDTLAYIDGAKALLKKLSGVSESDKLKLATAKSVAAISDKASSNKVAVYYAEGEIVSEIPTGIGVANKYICGQDVIEDVEALASDDDVKAVVLRINSPGGDAYASEQMWHALKELGKKKPLVVSMGGLAASGGYYMAVSGEYIFAEPTTLTGSIGIFGLIPDASELLTKKIGLTFDVVKTNKNSDFVYGDYTRPVAEENTAMIQSYVERGYALFMNRVSQGRHMTVEQVDSIGQGRVWTGELALKLGLVDSLGSLSDAVAYAAAKAGVAGDYEIKEGPEQNPWYMDFVNTVEGNYFEQKVRNLTGESYEAFRALQMLKVQGNIQARMPYLPNIY